jgi:hypothetical protein
VKRHWAILALLACVAPLLLAFVWQGGLASLGDDSASYLAQAQAFSRSNAPILPWVAYHTHFPPLFGLVLSLTGGDGNFLVAHVVVALFAVAALALAYRFVFLDTGSRAAAFGVVAAFILCPTAWISAKGILSEPMFLCVSLAALGYHQVRLADGRGVWQSWLVLGLLLAATVLTRIVGVTLVAALLVQLGIQGWRERRWPPLAHVALAVMPATILLALWTWLRPFATEDSYMRVSGAMVTSWSNSLALMAKTSAQSVLGGWVASFTADSDVGMAAKGASLVVAFLALSGMIHRLLLNRLDAWYVALSIVVLFGWVFSEDNSRRLLYPLLPLMLFHAGQIVVEMCRGIGRPRWAPAAVGATGIVLAVAALPAIVLVGEKSLDRATVVVNSPLRYSDMTEYYTTANVQRARTTAGKHVAVLAGLGALQIMTPPNARIMWMRPEYVALLGRREASAWLYEWPPAQLAREVRDRKVDYLVAATLFKTDIGGRSGNPFQTLSPVTEFAEPRLMLSNPATSSTEFVLLQVDPARLAAYLAKQP